MNSKKLLSHRLKQLLRLFVSDGGRLEPKRHKQFVVNQPVVVVSDPHCKRQNRHNFNYYNLNPNRPRPFGPSQSNLLQNFSDVVAVRFCQAFAQWVGDSGDNFVDGFNEVSLLSDALCRC